MGTLHLGGNAPDQGFKTMSESYDSMLQFFASEHLPAELQAISAPFRKIALHVVETLPRNAERTTALRKLLEAKDCAVRARLYKQGT